MSHILKYELMLSNEEMKKRIENIIRRSKSEGNNTCFVLHLGSDGFLVRGGEKYPTSAVFLSFTTGDDMFIFNNNTSGSVLHTHDFKEMWVLGDIKRKQFFIRIDEKYIVASSMTLLFDFGSDVKPNTFQYAYYISHEVGEYFIDRSVSGLIYDILLSDYATLKSTLKSEKEDKENE